MMVAILVLVAGSRLYRSKIPHGSPLTTIAQVVVAAVCKKKVAIVNERVLYEGTTQSSRVSEKLYHID